jgi:hypothetical protein
MASMDSLVDDSVASARLVWLTGASDRKQFGELLVEATRAHVADDEQSRASFAWWRSDWDAIQRHKDGLTIDGIGLRPLCAHSASCCLRHPGRLPTGRSSIAW